MFHDHPCRIALAVVNGRSSFSVPRSLPNATAESFGRYCENDSNGSASASPSSRLRKPEQST